MHEIISEFTVYHHMSDMQILSYALTLNFMHQCSKSFMITESMFLSNYMIDQQYSVSGLVAKTLFLTYFHDPSVTLNGDCFSETCKQKITFTLCSFAFIGRNIIFG